MRNPAIELEQIELARGNALAAIAEGDIPMAVAIKEEVGYLADWANDSYYEIKAALDNSVDWIIGEDAYIALYRAERAAWRALDDICNIYDAIVDAIIAAR